MNRTVFYADRRNFEVKSGDIALAGATPWYLNDMGPILAVVSTLFLADGSAA